MGDCRKLTRNFWEYVVFEALGKSGRLKVYPRTVRRVKSSWGSRRSWSWGFV